MKGDICVIEDLGAFAEPFVIIGMITFLLLVLLFFANIYVSIKDRIKLSIKKYRDKHKFKKPPTAKCYCIACQLWYAHDNDRSMGRCEAWTDYHTSAEEFCSRGFPRDNDGYKYEECRLEDRS